MKTKTITTIAIIAIMALIAVGLGYAYTSTTTTESNNVYFEDIQVLPLYEKEAASGTDPAVYEEKYTGSVAYVKYDTSISGTGSTKTVKYGVEKNTQTVSNVEIDVGQSLTDICMLNIVNEGSKAKILNKITVRIIGNDYLVDQMNGNDYKNKFKMTLSKVNGAATSTVTDTAFDYTAPSSGDKYLTFELDCTGFAIEDRTIEANNASNPTQYAFSFVIMGDDDYPHSNPLNKNTSSSANTFKVEYKAEAQDAPTNA